MSAIILLGLRILLAVLLYAFLGFAVYVVMRDIKQQGMLLAARQPPPIKLTNLTDGNEKSVEYSKPEVILGRESSCDFALDDQAVSSQHARLSYRKQQWWLEDLASTNGTFLNGEPVTSPVVITHRDELRLGHVEVRIEISPGTTKRSG